ncbi:Carboxypeptidase regulatory-like domain-containing protein [Agreia bicolorata]|uniref:Carboxypeptidase regulatory-like domain-containing protein n=1 Tax=Agreia bicolorata TaxID=110935 RepID=A0A1T4XP58_9MICO|nr:carboxypeptidase-like regulatory domain-containing protein [Agreia bicolorata]SKA90901.1 Carboxypeptidase regulatory-like domain-containing protein [Agreia bicolorata]
MKRTLSAVAALSLAVLGIAVAPSAAWAATTTVSGTVTDAALNPIVGAKVRYLTANSEYDFYTDSAGHYGGPISPESYVVKFQAAGFAAEYFDDSVTLAGATPRVLAQGSDTVSDAVLGAESTLSGTITAYTGDPVQAGVQLFSENDGWESVGYVQSSSVDGGYDFGGLAAGNYKISVVSPDSDDLVDEWYSDRLTEVEATIITVPPVGSATADVQLAEGAIIGGSVKNTIGSPVDMQLFASNTIQPDAVRAITSGGVYSFSGLAPANYTISTYEHDLGGFFAAQTLPPVAAVVGSPATADIVVTPALPAESEITDEIVPHSGPLVVAPGGTYTWTVPSDEDSDVYAILYSTPVYIGAAPAAVNGVATLTLTIPSDTAPGAHKLSISSYSDSHEGTQIERGYFALTVLAATGPTVDPGTDPATAVGAGGDPSEGTAPHGAAASLANTGLPAAPILAVAPMLLVAGVLLRTVHRRRA